MKAFTSRLIPVLGLLVLAAGPSALADSAKTDPVFDDLRALKATYEKSPQTKDIRSRLAEVNEMLGDRAMTRETVRQDYEKYKQEVRDSRRLEAEIEAHFPQTDENRQDLSLIRDQIAAANSRLESLARAILVMGDLKRQVASGPSPEELSIKVYQNIGHGMVMLLGSYPDQKTEQAQSSNRQESDKTLFPVIPISVAFPDGIAGGGIDFTSSGAK